MKRRTFLKQTGLGVATLSMSRWILGSSLGEAGSGPGKGREFYVATAGNDSSPGTINRPFATLARAKLAAREVVRQAALPVSISVRGGTYYLDETLTFGPEDSGTAAAPITYSAYGDELVTISGGRRLECDWRPYRDGIFVTELPQSHRGLTFGQLFING